MKNFKVGLQLYSIRDKMEENMEEALKTVKEIGYDYVEFAGYFGKTAKEVKDLLDKYGLTAISVHQNPSLFWEEGQVAIDYLKEIGVEYAAIPWYTEGEYFNNWDETVKKFDDLGKTLKENGIQMLYHNHDFEFKKIGNETIIDRLYSEISSEFLEPEFDTCWIHYAGNDPAEYLKKYNGRVKVLHLKDFVCEKLGGGPVYGLIDASGESESSNDREDNGFKFKPVGQGIQNWNKILETAEEIGTEYVIVEQDEWYDGDSLEAAKQSREYLKSLGI